VPCTGCNSTWHTLSHLRALPTGGPSHSAALAAPHSACQVEGTRARALPALTRSPSRGGGRPHKDDDPGMHGRPPLARAPPAPHAAAVRCAACPAGARHTSAPGDHTEVRRTLSPPLARAECLTTCSAVGRSAGRSDSMACGRQSGGRGKRGSGRQLRVGGQGETRAVALRNLHWRGGLHLPTQSFPRAANVVT
jgi:hypothetical protein